MRGRNGRRKDTSGRTELTRTVEGGRNKDRSEVISVENEGKYEKGWNERVSEYLLVKK